MLNFNPHQLFELIGAFPNLAATLFGFIGIIVTGFFSYLLKRPLEKQAASVDLFQAQISGYESLTKTQANRIAYLEGQESLRVEYEAELVRQLREAHLVIAASGMPKASPECG